MHLIRAEIDVERELGRFQMRAAFMSGFNLPLAAQSVQTVVEDAYQFFRV